MKVFCYRNLHKKGVVWSVKDTSTGLVVDRATTVHISGAQLRVSKKGRDRVLKEKRKNVHAGIVGVRIKKSPPNLKWVRVTYNPYKTDSFVICGDDIPVLNAKYVKLTKKGCFMAVTETKLGLTW